MARLRQPASALETLARMLASRQGEADGALEKLKQTTVAGMVGEGQREKDAAVAVSASIAELSATMADAVLEVANATNDLQAAVSTAANSADRTTRQLGQYTLWLAIATGVLAFATIVLVFVEARKLW